MTEVVIPNTARPGLKLVVADPRRDEDTEVHYPVIAWRFANDEDGRTAGEPLTAGNNDWAEEEWRRAAYMYDIDRKEYVGLEGNIIEERCAKARFERAAAAARTLHEDS